MSSRSGAPAASACIRLLAPILTKWATRTCQRHSAMSPADSASGRSPSAAPGILAGAEARTRTEKGVWRRLHRERELHVGNRQSGRGFRRGGCGGLRQVVNLQSRPAAPFGAERPAEPLERCDLLLARRRGIHGFTPHSPKPRSNRPLGSRRRVDCFASPARHDSSREKVARKAG
jgi:hypothetical protein